MKFFENGVMFAAAVSCTTTTSVVAFLAPSHAIRPAFSSASPCATSCSSWTAAVLSPARSRGVKSPHRASYQNCCALVASSGLLQSDADTDGVLNSSSLQREQDALRACSADGSTPTVVAAAATAKKVLRSAGVALAWYLGSTVAAFAMSSAVAGGSGGVAAERMVSARPQKRVPVAGLLFILYIASSKNIKKRNRFEGVIPKDQESRQLLVDDVKDLALSWGKPAGRLAHVAVDLLIFLSVFSIGAFEFKSAAGVTGNLLLSPVFWLPRGILACMAGTGVAFSLRRFGMGYVRTTFVCWMAPIILAVVVKPAKAVASVVGMGGDWDTGLTRAEREARPSSYQLRKRLSTFEDVDLHGDAETDQDNDNNSSSSDGLDDSGDGSPPNLKRS